MCIMSWIHILRLQFLHMCCMFFAFSPFQFWLHFCTISCWGLDNFEVVLNFGFSNLEQNFSQTKSQSSSPSGPWNQVRQSYPALCHDNGISAPEVTRPWKLGVPSLGRCTNDDEINFTIFDRLLQKAMQITMFYYDFSEGRFIFHMSPIRTSIHFNMLFKVPAFPFRS